MFKEPIRKRGYHRALKRGESWAIMRKSLRDLMNDLSKQLFNTSPFSERWEEAAKLFGITFPEDKK